MDAKFHPAIAAMRSGDLETFKSLNTQDPTLATSRSSTSHPTLLQCVALDGKDKPNNVEMARVLIHAGAELNEPLVAGPTRHHQQCVCLRVHARSHRGSEAAPATRGRD